jgi:hypothetical protein
LSDYNNRLKYAPTNPCSGLGKCVNFCRNVCAVKFVMQACGKHNNFFYNFCNFLLASVTYWRNLECKGGLWMPSGWLANKTDALEC